MKKLNGTEMQQRLYLALTELLDEKNIKQITVVTLVQHAHVSRGTFYLYYRNIAELVQDMEAKLFAQINSGQAVALKKAIELTASGPEANKAFPAFLALAQVVQNYFTLFKSLASRNGDPYFWSKFEVALGDNLFAALPEQMENSKFFSDMPADYAIPVFMSSIITILRHWLEKNRPEAPDTIARLITKSRYVSPYQLFLPKH